jgi:mRNA-degrading endonuclease toxin of MazEF toxin-antitoxin module
VSRVDVRRFNERQVEDGILDAARHQYRNRVMIAPTRLNSHRPIGSVMSSTHRIQAMVKPRYLVPVAAREAALPKDGFVKCDELATYPTVLLGPKLGRLNPEAIGRLDDALRFVLGL